MGDILARGMAHSANAQLADISDRDNTWFYFDANKPFTMETVSGQGVAFNIPPDVTSINLRHGVTGFTGQIYWTDVHTWFDGRFTFVTSPLGVADCLLVPDLNTLIYDMTTSKLDIIPRGNFDSSKHIMFMTVASFYPIDGLLVVKNLDAFRKSASVDIPGLRSDVNSLRSDVDTIGNPFLPQESLPSYDLPEVTTTKSGVLAVQTATTTSFAYMTDLHYTNLYPNGYNPIRRAFRAVSELKKFFKIEFLFLGGDFKVEEPKSAILAMYEELSYYPRNLLGDTKVFPVKGNHDDNSLYDYAVAPGHPLLSSVDTIWPVEEYNRLFKHNENIVQSDPANRDKMYYYYDLPDAKIRCIFLNAIDIPYIVQGDNTLKYRGINTYSFSNEQLNWVASKALDFSSKGTDKTGWSVLVFSHVSMETALTDVPITNAPVMLGILNAYKAETSYTSTPTTGDFAQSVTVDFTTQGAMDLIACLYGHLHRDLNGVYSGITHIGTLCATGIAGLGSGAPTMTADTVSETAFDIFTIDKTARKIYTTRFGAGDDRIISY